MDRQKRTREIVSILMESSMYFNCPLKERLELIHVLVSRFDLFGYLPLDHNRNHTIPVVFP